MSVRLLTFPVLALLLLASVPALAQDAYTDPNHAAASAVYDQRVIGEFLDRQGSGPMPEADVPFRAFTLAHETGNSVLARHELYLALGEGNAALGRERARLGILLGGQDVTQMRLGDRIILPANPSDFELDPRAFAPFPLEYPGAARLGKIIVIHKDVQAWAAYEDGQLLRWGPASTGAKETPAPNGRFTINWRAEERISSESPPGQEWLMRWVLNIHFRRGIHIHQYAAVPIGAPQGIGCVRVVEADARWLYAWADPWTTTAGRGALGGRVLREGTTVLVLGEDTGLPGVRFRETADGGIERVVVELPADPMRVPRGDR